MVSTLLALPARERPHVLSSLPYQTQLRVVALMEPRELSPQQQLPPPLLQQVSVWVRWGRVTASMPCSQACARAPASTEPLALGPPWAAVCSG